MTPYTTSIHTDPRITAKRGNEHRGITPPNLFSYHNRNLIPVHHLRFMQNSTSSHTDEKSTIIAAQRDTTRTSKATTKQATNHFLIPASNAFLSLLLSKTFLNTLLVAATAAKTRHWTKRLHLGKLLFASFLVLTGNMGRREELGTRSLIWHI